MFPGVDLGGAGQRLLAEDIPLRFFGTAVACHVLAWVALVIVADDAALFSGGASPMLAAVHVLTVGVLVLTAMGSSFQMLPVALGRPAPPALACNAGFGLVVAGATLLIAGFAVFEPVLAAVGAAVLAAAVALFAVVVARVIRGSQEMQAVVLHVWTALAALLAGTGLAVALALDNVMGVLSNHASAALAHALLMGYGFMGMLALGLSQVVVPLFAVALVPYSGWAEASYWCAAAGLVLAVLGIGLGEDLVVFAALVAGLAAAGLHLRLMTDVVAKRMRRRLGREFLLIRASWGLLPASLAIGGVLLFGGLADTGPALFGFVLVYGWLLTLLLGVLQRIVPLLASMHTGRPGRPPAAPSELTAERPLEIHQWCHFAALALVAGGIAAAEGDVVRAGAAIGTVGGLSYLVFTVTAFRRMRRHMRRAPGPQAPAARSGATAAEPAGKVGARAE